MKPNSAMPPTAAASASWMPQMLQNPKLLELLTERVYELWQDNHRREQEQLGRYPQRRG